MPCFILLQCWLWCFRFTVLPPRLGYNSRPRWIINFMSDSTSYVTFVGFFHVFLLSKCIVPLNHLTKCSGICEIRLKFNLIAKLFWSCTNPGTAHFGQGISPEELSILRPFHTARNALCAQTCSQRVSYPAFAPSFLLSMFYPHSHCSCTDLTWSKEAARPLWFFTERAIDLCPECFPGCKTAKKYKRRASHYFSSCCVQLSQKVSLIPKEPANYLSIPEPPAEHNGNISPHLFSSCWAPPQVWDFACFHNAWLETKILHENETLNLCHQNMWIIFKELHMGSDIAGLTPSICGVWKGNRFNTAKK